LIKRNHYPHAANAIATFMAQTLFHTSMLASSAEDHKARIALFAPNTALCKITEDLVFTDPYREAPLNRWTRPYLDAIKSAFENDVALKIAVQKKKWQFVTEAQALIHGDLHTGSVMVTETDTRVIDPEFAFVGPMGFDVGAVLANFLLSYFSHRGQTETSGHDPYWDWLLAQLEEVWTHFERRFLELWTDPAPGEVFSQGLFGDKASEAGLSQYKTVFMRQLFHDSLGFAGCKMIRRILGLAHVEDLESISDLAVRARCETLALTFARELILQAARFTSISDVAGAAREHVKATAK
jgi:5-methylthioribose kinase